MKEKPGSVFKGRFQFGQFDPKTKMPWDALTGDDVYSEANQQIALEAAQQSAVLLRNPAGKAQLPLKKGLTIAVVVISQALEGIYDRTLFLF